MALVKRLTKDELALAEIIKNPIWCGEFIHSLEATKEHEFKYTDYQKLILADFNPYVSLCTARAVGKTLSIIDKLVWFSLNRFWDETIIYTVPNRVHLEPVFLRLTNWFRKHKFLRFYTGKYGINSQTFTIKLNNGAVISCRIAGNSGTGANVIGLHVPVIILDEAAFYPWGTWIELLPTLNTWQEGYQLIVAGVPIGMREKNVLYFTDRIDKSFTKHRVSSHDNPRYTKIDEERNIKQYGGADSDDYLHMVLGEHGAPTYNMFDRDKMALEKYQVFKASISGQSVRNDATYLFRLYNSLPAAPANIADIVFGIDLGYTEPTVVMILYRKTKISPWKFLARLTLTQVTYPTQEIFIDTLDTHYNPTFIAIDEGNAGKSLVQHMHMDEKYKKKKYKERLLPINFRSNVQIGVDSDGKAINVRAKQFGMQMLQSKINNHEIVISNNDDVLIGELERTTYNKTPSGELVFKTFTPRGGTSKAEDHNTAALICFVVGLYLTEESDMYLWNKKIKLFKPRWL